MSARRYRFEGYELDPAARELRDARGPVAVAPKSFDCLVYLLERRERAVGRDELISAVWGRIDVSDALLGQTLARARRAVGDTGEDQRVIRTVARFGYHWVAPVDVVAAGVDEAPSGDAVAAGAPVAPAPAVGPAQPRTDAPASGAPPRRAHRLRRLLAAGAAATVLCAALLVAVPWRGRDEGARAPSPVAGVPATSASAATAPAATEPAAWLVLPVEVAGDEAGSRWIRFGAMDYLAARLRERAGVTVLPVDQTIALLAREGEAVDPAQRLRFAAGVGASTVLAARAARDGDGWTVELDIRDAEHEARLQASAPTALEAADLALARHFGLESSQDASMRQPLLELQQRIDAAFLEGDVRGAAELVESAPPELRREPAIAVRAAEVDERSGRLAAAEQGFERVAAAGDALAPPLRARAAYGLCTVAYRRNVLDRAQSHCGDALAALQGSAEPMLLGRIHMLRAMIEVESGHPEEALANFGLARIEWRRAGNRVGEASVDNNEGMALAWQGRHGEAIAAFDRAVATFEQYGVQDHLASTLAARADAQRTMLDLPGALASSERAWRLTPRMADARAVHSIAFTRALTLLASGQADEALRIVERYDDGGASALPEFVVLRRAVLRARGEAAAAVADAESVFERVLRPADPTSDATPAWAAGLLVEAAFEARAGELAARLLARLEAAGDAATDPDQAYVEALARARIADIGGDAAAAARHYADAFARALEQHRPDRTVVAGAAYARYLLGAGRVDEATRVAGRFAVYADRDADAAQAMIELHERLGDDESLRLARERRERVHARAALASG